MTSGLDSSSSEDSDYGFTKNMDNVNDLHGFVDEYFAGINEDVGSAVDEVEDVNNNSSEEEYVEDGEVVQVVEETVRPVRLAAMHGVEVLRHLYQNVSPFMVHSFLC